MSTVPPISEDKRPTSGRGKKAISRSDYYPIWWRCYIKRYNQR